MALKRLVLIALFVAAWMIGADAQTPRRAPVHRVAAQQEFGGFSDTQGGFLVERTDTSVRNQDTTNPSTYLPSTRVKFRFPDPYNTDAIRMTLGGTAAGQDCFGTSAVFGCARQTGYSDWQNPFYMGPPSSATRDVICAWNDFYDLGVKKGCFTLSTNTHSGWVNIFEVGDPLRFVGSATDSWQTSPSEENVLYVKGGEGHLWEYLRCNTGSGVASLPISSTDGVDCVIVGNINTLAARTQMAAVLGGTEASYLNNVKVWSPHVSADGTKFSATIKNLAGSDLGAIFMTAPDTWVVKPVGGDPFVDLSGTYGAMAVGAITGCPATTGNNFIVFALANPGTHFNICDLHGGSYPGGAPGHLAFGHGYMLASDNDASSSGGAGFEQVKLWNLANIAAGGTLVTSYPSSFPNGFGQPAWGTAVPAATTAIANQMVCHTNVASDGAPNPAVPRERELYCYRPGDDTHLVVAPQMTDMDSTGSGGGEDENNYYKGPKPNISTDGRWYYLCTNHWTSQMDCFFIRIPRNNLPAPGPPPSPLEQLTEWFVQKAKSWL